MSLSVNAGINHCQRTDKASSETAFCESIESLLQTYWGRRINLGITQKKFLRRKMGPSHTCKLLPDATGWGR